MFGIFKKKSKKEILEREYRKLMEESYKLSTVDRKKSDLKRAEADKIANEIENLGN